MPGEPSLPPPHLVDTIVLRLGKHFSSSLTGNDSEVEGSLHSIVGWKHEGRPKFIREHGSIVRGRTSSSAWFVVIVVVLVITLKDGYSSSSTTISTVEVEWKEEQSEEYEDERVKHGGSWQFLSFS
mmetsp:Transcript_27544/g.66196  ORF Transcript_27544/g.66196 Transcript_27544/m.66196 type:complete len:126 (+) Transcript_27544:1717-2094(+)